MSASAAVLHLHNDLTHTVDEPGKINIPDSVSYQQKVERWILKRTQERKEMENG